MSLVTIYTNDTAGKQAKLKDQVQRIFTSNFNNLSVLFNNSKNFIWNNADGLTPQQAVDAFGSDFATLMNYANLLANLLNGVSPGTAELTPPNGHTLTVNNDGTGTVT